MSGGVGERGKRLLRADDGGGARFGARDLLDTPAERAFDRITGLAAKMLRAPVSLISVLDERRNYFKSAFGLPSALDGVREVPLSHSYCRHVLVNGRMLAVHDTADDPVVGSNPANTDFGVRAYLGLPVFGADGTMACSLCVLDMEPRIWSDSEIAIMTDLVEILETELALREEVSFRKVAEERNALLLREMEHRVKNSLATVQAIISMSLKGVADAEGLRHTILERIASLSQTHSLLLQADWRHASFGDLLKAELGHYDGDSRISIEGAEIEIAAQDAVVVGMIVHELTTNAIKYGALAGEGTIRIRCTETPLGSSRRVGLEWSEMGVALVGAPDRSGFGSTLLEALVVRQHDGSVVRDWTADGLRLVIDMELSAPV